jgi:hypothetical protein
MESKLMVKTDIQVKTRLETLYLYIFEFLQSFGANSDCFETLRKGILEKRILKAIHVKFKNKDSVIVGEIVIEIDWDKYELLAKTNYGATFTFDTNKSLREQLLDITIKLDAHIKKIKKEFNVVNISTSYKYLDDIRKDLKK